MSETSIDSKPVMSASVVYDDVNKRVVTACYGTDDVVSYGNITTTIQSTTSTNGDVSVSMNLASSVRPPHDGKSCAELIAFARDNISHWEKVLQTLEAVAASFAG